MFRAFTRPRYQVSVYRNIGPLVYTFHDNVVAHRLPTAHTLGITI